MEKSISYVGLDVHKKDIVVAMLLPGAKKAEEWTLSNEPRAIRRLAKKLKRMAAGEVVAAYEAGPCGYVLQRQLRGLGIGCTVVAPSLIPRKPGDRIKTDRRDAKKLAELHRAGLLTEVHPPSEEEEALRDFCRCREDLKEDLTRARHRLGKFLLRHGLRYGPGRAWTQRHRQWLWSLSFESAASKATYEDYMVALEQLETRLREVDTTLEELSREEPYSEPAAWLRCFRGIDTVTAMTILAELHDFRRFQSARQLMSYLGLVPSEHSSSDSVRRGAITKAGNSHVRRVLVEAAWHYRHKPAVGARLRKRRKGQPAEVIVVADKAQHRLHKRYWRLIHKNNKPTQKATVAVARELVGFIWAVLYPAAQAADDSLRSA
jgi:transposase